MTSPVNALPRMTSDEFLVWAHENAPVHAELVDGEVVAMAGGSKRHARTKVNVTNALNGALDAGTADCAAFAGDIAFVVDEGTLDFPDVVVECDGNDDLEEHAAGKPVIVVEVLSKSTSGHDRGAKLADHFRVPSVYHYLLADAVRKHVIHHQREGERIATAIRSDGTLSLDPPGITVDVSDCWRGLPDEAQA